MKQGHQKLIHKEVVIMKSMSDEPAAEDLRNQLADSCFPL